MMGGSRFGSYGRSYGRSYQSNQSSVASSLGAADSSGGSESGGVWGFGTWCVVVLWCCGVVVLWDGMGEVGV